MASSGNSYGNCIGSVASSSLAITVASSNDMGTVNRNDDQFSAFSTFGPRTDLDLVNPTIGMLKPDITAPGTGIFSVQGESGNTADLYHSLSGTSMAAPFVSGAVALLIDLKYDIPPGAIKDLLKRTAFLTPDHIAGGASYPTIDTVYNVNWGYGLIDLHEAATQLSTGITDISFTDCVGAHPDYPNCRRCLLSGGKSTYQNNVDIQVATDPPVKGQPNIITVTVENRGGAPAYNVVVCVGANQLGIGLNEFYDVSCEEISVINDGATASISVPWTSILANHQCIKASIDYGFDTDYTNNHTQRNINAIDLTSNPGSANASFTVQNPLNEPADIVLRVESKVEDCPGQYGLAYLGCPLLEVNIYGVLIGEEFTMRPEDCPKLANLDITPTSDYLPPGYKATIDVGGRAYSDTHPKGIELPFRSNYDALPLNRLSESFSNIIMNSYL